MRRRFLLKAVGFGLILGASLAPTVAAADAPGAPAAGKTEYAYGADSLQTLDFWPATGTKPAPLIVFVHGGGWKRGDKGNATGADKVTHWVGDGYALASINYRLVPDATVEQQAGDVAAAVAWLRGHAEKLGIDTARVVLMGHSAGAHLVALVGTDPQYFAAAGLSYQGIRGVIALDGACYDVARQIAEGGRFMRSTYQKAFGDDPVRQRALSPTFQAAAPNAPAFLIAYVDRDDGTAQSEALAAALRQAGTLVEIAAFEGKGLRGHMAINRSLGRDDYPATAVVDTWLRKVLGAK
jgi:acetyl esterase/lipase